MTLIQCRGGSIIVDTSANTADAREIVEAFGGRLRRQVRAIIFTHNHPDHSSGAEVAEGDAPDIYSHQTLIDAKPEFRRGPRGGGDVFGTSLPDALFINAGIQLEYGRTTPHTREGFLPPNRTFRGAEETIEVGGVEMRLIHTPGKSPENASSDSGEGRPSAGR